MKRKILTYVFALALIFLTLWMILRSEEISGLSVLISKTNKYYLMLAFMSIVCYWIFDAAIIKMSANMLQLNFGTRKSLKFTMIGQYYGSITPFALGCQPAQIYAMTSDGVPAGKASSIIINKYILYQVVVMLYSILMLPFVMGFIWANAKVAVPFIFIGILVHVAGTMVLFGLAFNYRALKRIITRIISLISRMNLIKSQEIVTEKVMKQLDEYMKGLGEVRARWRTSNKIILLTCFQLTCYFSIAYFIYRALEQTGVSYIMLLALGAVQYVAVSYMPTPGSVGASEGGFYLLLNPLMKSGTMAYATLLWNIISYQTGLVFGAAFSLGNYIDRRVRRRRKRTRR